MENSQNVVGQSSKKSSKKNFMWGAKKEKFLISYLADCARSGEKNGKSFGRSVFKKAAKAVSETFQEECTVDNVDARMKTVRKRYTRITTLRGKSGWGWDDMLKMIKVDKVDALNFIEENPYAKDYLNVPLEQYDELKLICGEDQATGNFGKSFNDVQCVEVCNEEEESATQGTSVGPSTTNESSMAKSGRKRSRPWEEALQKIDGLTKQVAHLSEAMISCDQDFCQKVFDEVFKMKEFEDRVLNKAFEYLTEHPLAG